jgi:uncharacterized protein YceK
VGIGFQKAFAVATVATFGLGSAAFAGTPTTLYTFTGAADGAYPAGGLVSGSGGSFYGTTLLGGSGCSGSGCGTIFKLTAPAAGKTGWTLKTIYRFNGGTDGQEPVNLIADATGNLFGVATYGGVTANLCTVGGTVLGCGTVFELSPPAAGTTAWTFTTLYSFTGGADGSFPNYGLAQDAAGALFGFTYGGGTCATKACGTVFRLTPPAAGHTAWTELTLHDFAGGKDGTAPYSTPLVMADGTVYGTTTAGGVSAPAACLGAGGCGTVFSLTPAGAGKPGWTKKTVWSFASTDGLYPEGSLIADSAGNIYGTANLGGATTICTASGSIPAGCGAVFELSPPAAGATAWTRKTLYKFAASGDGLYPAAGLTPSGTSFFTTTSGNGLKGFGSVLELSPPATGAKAWTEKTLFDFTNVATGAQPTDALLLQGGVLYGTTLGHDGVAPARYGTIFSILP